MFARQVSREQLVPIMCGGTIPKLDREQLVPIVLGWPVPSLGREHLVPIMCGGTIPKLDREQLVPIVLGRPVPSLGREHLVPIMCGGTIPKLDREQLVSIVLGRPVPSLGREHLVHILLVWSNVLNWRDPVLLKLLTVIDLFVRSVCVVRELPIVRSGHVSIVLVTHALFVHIMLGGTIPKLDREQLVSIMPGRSIPTLH